MTAEASQSPADRPFVGRATELGTLRNALDAARSGRGGCVLVTGDAGIGKTSTVTEVLRDLPPARVLWGRCQEIEGAPAYWPWSQALRALVRQHSADAARALAGPAAPQLARLVPAFGTGSDEQPGSADEEPETARYRLFDAVAGLLRRFGNDGAFAVVLDDLHWADSESLLLLDFVATEVRDAQVLLVGTYRDAELGTSTTAARLLAGLSRAASRIPLRGLDASGVGDLLAAARGEPPAPALVASVHQATAGNPFFVGEIGELLRAEHPTGDGGARVGFRVPDTVREAIRRRLDGLDDESRTLLRHAAVLGQEIDVEVLSAIAGRSTTDVLGALDPAVRRGVLQPGGHPGAYRFPHALLQDALAAELTPLEQARAHLQAGEAIERIHRGDVDAVAGELAHHFLQAGAVGGLPKAVTYASRAGDRAMATLGFEEAAGHYERALAAERAAGSDPARRLDLLLEFGHAQRLAGDEDGARATLLEGAKLARERGDATALARAALHVAAARAETGSVDPLVIGLLEDALPAVGTADSVLRARLLGMLAGALYFAADGTRRDALSIEAVAVARRVGDPAALAASLVNRQFVLWRPGTVVERLTLIDEAIAIADRAGHPDTAAWARAWRIVDLVELGRFAYADVELTRHAADAERIRLPLSLWHATLVRAARALFDGRLDEAEQLAMQARAQRQDRARNNAEQFFLLQLFHVRAAQGRLAEIAEPLRAFTGRAGLPPIWRCGIAAVDATLGHTDAARRITADLAAADFAALPRDCNWLPALASLAEVCDLTADAEHAARIYPLLQPHADLTIVSGLCAVINGFVRRFLGVLALTAGQLNDAVQHLDKALGLARNVDASAEVVRAAVALARALTARARPGDLERAQALRTEARTTAAARGLHGLVAALGDGESRAAAPSPTATTGTLRREGDVWTIRCGNEVTRLRDAKGMGYLQALLRHPTVEVHALDLARGATGERTYAGDAGEAVDDDARRAYRRRHDELTAALATATGSDAARLRSEQAALERELKRATGLGGRARRTGSDAERARLNVTRALDAVVKKVSTDCPRLGRHLERAVRTGTFCAYEPDPGFPIDWDV